MAPGPFCQFLGVHLFNQHPAMPLQVNPDQEYSGSPDWQAGG